MSGRSLLQPAEPRPPASSPLLAQNAHNAFCCALKRASTSLGSLIGDPSRDWNLFGLNVSRHNLTRSVGAGATWSHRDGGALALAPAGLNPEAVTVGPWTCPPEPQFSPCSGRTPVLGTQRSQDVW